MWSTASSSSNPRCSGQLLLLLGSLFDVIGVDAEGIELVKGV